MVTWILESVRPGIADLPDGGKLLMYKDDQSGLQVHIPLGPEDVKRHIAMLNGGNLQVAQGIPDQLLRNGHR